jgi:hypothetical protein
MPRMVIALMIVVAVGVTIFLIGGALIQASLWNAAYAFMLALAIRDWWRWRSSVDMTPREVADRFMPHLVIFAIGVAMPVMRAFESWMGW